MNEITLRRILAIVALILAVLAIAVPGPHELELGAAIIVLAIALLL